MPVADFRLRKYNISQRTFYRWKSAYSGMQVLLQRDGHMDNHKRIVPHL